MEDGRAATGGSTLFEFTFRGEERKQHAHQQARIHTETVYLSDVEECLYVGSH